MSRYLQTTFSGGELSPQLYGRIDLAWYYNSVALMDNMYSLKFGGTRKRPGFQFIAETKNNAPARLIGFKVANSLSYMCEFGDLYVRFFFGAGPIEQRIDPSIQVFELVTPFTADELYELHFVQSKDVMFITHKSKGIFKLRRLTADTFDLVEFDYKWGPFKSENIEEIFIKASAQSGPVSLTTEEYAAGFLPIDWDGTTDPDLHFAYQFGSNGNRLLVTNDLRFDRIQPGDEFTIVGTASNDGTWTCGARSFNGPVGFLVLISLFSPDEFVPEVLSGSGVVTVTGGVVIPAVDLWKIEDVGSFMRLRELTETEHDTWEPDRRDKVTGDELPYQTDQLATYDDNVYKNMSLTGPNGRRPPTHTFGTKPDGEFPLPFLNWQYEHSNQGYFLIEEFISPTQVNGIVIETLPSSYVEEGNYLWSFSYWGPGLDDLGDFSGLYGYPNAIGFHQGRLWLAGSPEFPQTLWSSESDNYESFKIEYPIEDDDGITYFLDSRLLSTIEHLLQLGELITYTNGAEWKIMPQGDNILTPASVGAFSQSFIGSGVLPPLLIDNDSLFLDTAQRRIYSFGYNFSNDKYLGDDLSIKADHLFAGHFIQDWTYAREPNDIIWLARDDGVMVGLTYMPTQEVFAWHQHHTQGEFESLESVTFGGYDVVYAVVKRVINGVTKRYIEIMQSDRYTTIDDAFYVDSGLTYDGRIEGKMGPVTLPVSVYPAAVVMTSTPGSVVFDVTDVGRTFIGSDGTKYLVTVFTSATSATVQPNRDQGGGTVTITGIAATTFSGLEHLQNMEVVLLGDGSVYDNLLVVNGSLTIDIPVLVAHIGLSYEAHIETLDLEVKSKDGSNQGRKNNVQDVMLRVVNSRDILVGPNKDQLRPIKARNDESYQDPPLTKNGDYIITAFPQWKDNARVHIANKTPTPLELSLLAPRIVTGGS